MQQRQLLMLLGVLGVLIFIAFFSGAFSNEFSEMDVPVFNIDRNQIDQIAISVENEPPIVLVKEESLWVLNKPIVGAADSIALTRLTENIGMLELESVASTNPDRYENYGVTESAQKLVITAGDEEHTLYIGKSGPDYQSIFLRLDDDPRVFVTNGRLNAPQELDTWRDKTITKLSPTGLEQIEVTSPSESYTVRSEAGNWLLDSDSQTIPADSADVMHWIGRFSNLKGLGFDSASPRDVQSQATHVLTFISRGGGETLTFWLSEEENKLIGVISEQENTVFTLSKNMLTSFVPESNTLAQAN